MSFDTLAPFYGLMERLAAGNKMQRCRVAFLDQIPQPANILLLGEGHGRFLKPCRDRFPEARIIMVDSSEGMMARARSILAAADLESGLVEFVHADLLTWTPPGAAYDLIVSHFFLDCFRAEQLADMVPRLAGAAAPGASWLLADFEVAPVGWRRRRTQAILALLYAFFRVTTRLPAKHLTPPGPLLNAAGFTLHRRIEMEWGLLKSEWWRKEYPNHHEQTTN
jgi:hypothetical protein